MSIDRVAAADDAAGGVVHIPAYDLPPSVYMSEPARLAFLRRAERMPAVGPGWTIAEYRAAMDEHFYKPRLALALAAFPAQIREDTIGGVPVHRVTPLAGVPAENRNRLLINLHGG